ncbi:MAG TPA: phytanoyl-CoA dioxygenase family protein [Haliangiales bacterium]|nr:phytanoyl-CoA dioxygenase family protein [Haliangiales bacterium]
MTAAQVAEHAGRVRRDGYSLVEDAIEPELVDALAEALLRLEVELGAAPAKNIFEGTRTVRIYNLLARGKVFERVPVHDSVLPIVEAVLDRGCLVSSLSSIAICEGEGAQPLHADDQLIPLPRPHVPIIVNSMWAITDFTEENGATRYVPGSHVDPTFPEFGRDIPTVAAVMRRGSVLVYNGSLWHGGGANRTPRRRVGIAMNYCAGWIRQQENQQLGIPLDVARGFSPRLRHLAGFGIYRRLIGHIDKCSPEDLLDGVGARRVVGEVG